MPIVGQFAACRQDCNSQLAAALLTSAIRDSIEVAQCFLGGIEQQDYLLLQTMVNRYQQVNDMISNILKQQHELRKSIIGSLSLSFPVPIRSHV